MFTKTPDLPAMPPRQPGKPFSLPLWLAGLAAGTALGMYARSRPRAEAQAAPVDAKDWPDSASRPEPADDRPFGEAAPNDEPQAVHKARAQETGRGRSADSPVQIPLAGWRDIAWRTYAEIQNDRLLAVAAGVVFYGLLALFPAITALVSSYALFAEAATIGKHLAFAAALMPSGAYGIVEEQITRIAQGSGGGLSTAFLLGLLLAIWSANAGMKAMIDALNVIYGETEERSFVRLNLLSLAMTLGGLVFLLIAIGTVIVLPLVFAWIGLQGFGEWAIAMLRWPAVMIVIALSLAALYRFGPSRRAAQWRWLSVGAVVAMLLWVAGSALFSWYLSNFADYNATYGSLGAGIGLMMWLWLTSIAILIGAEINAEIEHQTARDTTVGREKPIGTRGAVMADTVGAAQ
ncbi:MAG: YihY/virulence factor BrkB family protein [Pseudorhodoplanes sp.]|uniref:YihY/virulence factor BrkB family protein n=1 Tax=Pseudorhodoplanes sp. TaxID=1934341 RepID=UPI003D0CA5F1